MSVQSDAAKAHIEKLLEATYPESHLMPEPTLFGVAYPRPISWEKEYRFAPPRLWRFDYAVPAILCANLSTSSILAYCITTTQGVIELDGGTFQSQRTGHSSGVGLRAWREKNNAAMSVGWRVWHYAPEEVIKAGRKIGIEANL